MTLRFVILMPVAGPEAESSLTVVVNWSEELKVRVPAQ
jgi:hypothetical protein